MHPIEKSEDPYNGYAINCEATGRSTSYKLCLAIMDVIDRGKIGDSCQDCQIAGANGQCPARDMHRAEFDAGESLFYEESPLKKVHEDRSNPPEDDIIVRSPRTLSSESYQRGLGLLDSKLGASVSAVKARPVTKKADRKQTQQILEPHKVLLTQLSQKESQVRVVTMMSLKSFISQQEIKESVYAKAKY